jgi:cystathionine gamma-synthase
MSSPNDLQTQTVRAGLDTDTQFGAVVPPLHLSSTFSFAEFGVRRTYDYTRSGNPTRQALAEALAELEGGAGAVVTASGMAAITLVMQLCGAGELVVAPHDCYGGTHRLLSALARRQQLRVLFVDQTDAAALESALLERPKIVWIETPSNPLLRITDISAVAARAHACGAYVAVDNTFLSPLWQQPLRLGADVVVHSTTKYLNGHSDVVGGAVIAATAAMAEELSWWANCLGLAGAPFDSFMTLRGLRTVHARLSQHAGNAAAIVQALKAHSQVVGVHYPGLPEHPGHAIAARQQTGFGAMVSFELAGGESAVRKFLERITLFTLAESLGGVESLVAHPATMTHAAMDSAAQAAAGISQSLLRLSVGIESTQDLVRDLCRALDSINAVD